MDRRTRPASAASQIWPGCSHHSLSCGPNFSSDLVPTAAAAEGNDALGVLAEVLGQDSEQLSASQAWQQALADSDHLAILHAIWTAETASAGNSDTGPAHGRAAAGIPARAGSHGEVAVADAAYRAELTGLDARQVLADAAGERDHPRP